MHFHWLLTGQIELLKVVGHLASLYKVLLGQCRVLGQVFCFDVLSARVGSCLNSGKCFRLHTRKLRRPWAILRYIIICLFNSLLGRRVAVLGRRPRTVLVVFNFVLVWTYVAGVFAELGLHGLHNELAAGGAVGGHLLGVAVGGLVGRQGIELTVWLLQPRLPARIRCTLILPQHILHYLLWCSQLLHCLYVPLRLIKSRHSVGRHGVGNAVFFIVVQLYLLCWLFSFVFLLVYTRF